MVNGFISKFRHGLVEDLLIGFVAEVGDETALFGAKEIASTSDVEILHSDIDARAEIGEILESL